MKTQLTPQARIELQRIAKYSKLVNNELQAKLETTKKNAWVVIDDKFALSYNGHKMGKEPAKTMVFDVLIEAEEVARTHVEYRGGFYAKKVKVNLQVITYADFINEQIRRNEALISFCDNQLN